MRVEKHEVGAGGKKDPIPDTKPFVIRSLPRSGTHMLRTALDSHPEIVCHGEIFNANATGGKFADVPAATLHARHTGPGEGYVVHGVPDEDAAHYPTALDVWPVIERGRPVVLLLWRRDQLRRIASDIRAHQDRIWQRYKPGDWEKRPVGVEIPAEAVRRQIGLALKSIATGLRLYPWALQVIYEELLADWDNQLARIQRAIGVRQVLPLRPRTLRQGGGPIREVVLNYDALQVEFRGTKYARWFEIAEFQDG